MSLKELFVRNSGNKIDIIRTKKDGIILFINESKKPTYEPILKWAGGKQWLAKVAKDLSPDNWHGRYFEPFFGGGAFFFSLAPKRATLSDRNKELIDTYKAVRKEPEKIISMLNTYPNEREFFYRIRAKKPRTLRAAAVRFLYLNKVCWNGLYRVNGEGNFNTPFGKYKNPMICDKERIRKAAKLLKSVSLRVEDFQKSVSIAARGDFVYLDPPYITGHTNNGFHKYNAKLFSWKDQERLASVANDLKERGVHILVSNADHPDVIRLFSGFYYYKLARKSLIGGFGSVRGIITEALITSYPINGFKPEVF